VDLDPIFELSIYRRDGWQCIRCGSTFGLTVYHHGEPTADHPRAYGTYCASCAGRMPRL
jgi:hypothetical protein